MKQSVSSILISTDNEFILQQRDDNPRIFHSGMITNFGGGVEEGERPIDAIIREIQEELNIKLSKEDFRPLSSSARKSPFGNKEYIDQLFFAFNIKKQDLLLKEGKAIVYLKLSESLDSLNLSTETKKDLILFKKMNIRDPLAL